MNYGQAHPESNVLFVLALFAAAASIQGCSTPEPIVVGPPVETGPLLDGGKYALVVSDVNGLSCGEAVRPRDVIGTELRVDVLAGPDGRASVRMEGWLLDGEHGPGRLVADGELMAHTSTDDDVVVTEERRPVCADVPEEVEDVEEEPAPSGPWAALDLRVLEVDHAEGTLLWSMDGCEMDLAVVLRPIDEQAEPPVVEPQGGPPTQEEPGYPGEADEGSDGCSPEECP